jgi:hypothetical protein
MVRRDWALAHVPNLARRWEEEERRDAPRAARERTRRLEEWLNERPQRQGDLVRPWIEAEIQRLKGPIGPPRVWVVMVDRREIKTVETRPADQKRMLRQAWLAGFDDAETMPLDRLRDRLEARGFAQSAVDRASVPSLLGLPIENEPQWRLRRALTEIKYDSGNKFLRYHRLIWSEDALNAPMNGVGVVGLIDDLFDQDAREDPLNSRLRHLSGQGRMAAVVTTLTIADDFSVVWVEISIWARFEKARWLSYKSYPVTIQTANVAADAAAPLAGDPRVQAAFRLVESLGLGGAPGDAQRASLQVGAATRQALGQAQAAMSQDIEQLALPIGR